MTRLYGCIGKNDRRPTTCGKTHRWGLLAHWHTLWMQRKYRAYTWETVVIVDK